MLRFIKLALVTVFSVIFLDFAIVNREAVHISLFPLPYAADMPQFLLTILCFALGALVGGVAVNLKSLKNSRRFRAEHSRVIALENEIAVMREEQHNQPALPRN